MFGRQSIFWFLAMLLASLPAQAKVVESVCIGTTANGALIGGVQLPSSGPNFESYGRGPELLGRTYVHSKVRDVMVAAFAALSEKHPSLLFKYAETGKENGGPFPPHKTHQNGLSVDIMVPVRNAAGQPAHLPTNLLNRYGYDIEFDRNGRWEKYRIDFNTLGALIVALRNAAKQKGIGVRRVIFAPDLQAKLYAGLHGEFIREHIRIPKKRSWVRHDDHIHVDFDVPCKPK